MTVSHWWRSPSPPETSHDAVVVGAGICGIGVALALERRGLDVVLLDRAHPGAGASGRNAGFLMRGCAENYHAAIETYGRDRARELWRITEENLDALRAEGVADLPSYRAVPSCLLAYTDEEHAALRRSLDLLREDGFDAEWLDDHDDAAWRPASSTHRPRGALVNPHDASVNPVDLLRALTAKLRTPVRTNEEVDAIITSESVGHVRTAAHTYTAPRVFLCVNAYARLLAPALGALVRPTRGQMLALRAPGARLDMSYYANNGYEYFRQNTDGSIVVGGCRKRHAHTEVGYEDATTPEVQADLEAFARAVFGADIDVTARWSGVMGFSPDGVPLVGPVSLENGVLEPGSPVWLCAGFTGHGMSMAWRTAQLAVGAALDGAHNPFPIDRVHAHAPRTHEGAARG